METATCVKKREAFTETILKENKIPANVLLTRNHVSEILKWKTQTLDLMCNYYLWKKTYEFF